MKLTEDIAKSLMRRLKLPVPEGAPAETAAKVGELASEFGGTVALKALLPTGRRGKSGLVRLVGAADAEGAASEMLGRQTDLGYVDRIYVEKGAEIAQEFYLAFSFSDRVPMITISTAGGVEIEQVHATTPERIVTTPIDPLKGLRPWEAIDLWSRAGLKGRSLADVGRLTAKLWRAFVELDAEMMEINPLAVDADGRLSMVGTMIEIDDGALGRHPELSDVPSQRPDNPRERMVNDVNRANPGGDARYVELDGDIGLLVAGGGAGLLQHDMIVDLGGRPANHSDISPAPGTVKTEAVLDAVFTNPRSRSLLIGYNHLQMAPVDRVVEALANSVQRNKVDTSRFPIILRLFGPREAEARALAAQIGGVTYLPSGASLLDGARAIVEATRKVSAQQDEGATA
ncbi:ATP-grasp domain-containing protein [Aquicoccus sp.]|uniref:ATP-grasp domain-containing protein n=1 Tax=Aquicoccus sp. TaxID=2055851 RepID=UPI003562DF27